MGDGDEQYCAAGLAEGGLFYTSSSPTSGWEAAAAGGGLQEGPGSVRFQGFTHGADGTLQGWIDGAPAGAATNVGYTPFHGWSRIGAGGYAPVSYTGYPGSLGAVVILPHAADAATVARMQQWAHGRFATPACAPAGKPTLALSALTRPSGSQKLKLAAVLSLPDPLAPPVDPVLDGARIEVRDAEGTIADVLLPPGAYDPLARTGWKANGARTSFTFLQPSTAGLVTRASVKLMPGEGRQPRDPLPGGGQGSARHDGRESAARRHDRPASPRPRSRTLCGAALSRPREPALHRARRRREHRLPLSTGRRLPGQRPAGAVSLRPITDTSSSTRKAIRAKVTGSRNSTIPSTAAPSAPMPTHTA